MYLRKEKLQRVLKELLKEEKKHREDVGLSPKSAEWKVRIVKRLRETKTARNAWIAESLKMGRSSPATDAIREYSNLCDPFLPFRIFRKGSDWQDIFRSP